MQTQFGVSEVSQFVLRAQPGAPITQHITATGRDPAKIYAEKKYNFITRPPGGGEWVNRLINEKLQFFFGEIEIKKSTRVLDIGAGSTWIADRFRESFGVASYTCIDPALQDSAEEYPKIVQAYFPIPEIVSQQFDLILAFNVLEHVSSALDFLKSIKLSLAEGGMAVFSVPDCARFLERGDINGFLHEHLTYFTESSLRAMLDFTGLRIVKLISDRDLFSVIVTHGTVRKEALAKLDERNLLRHFHGCVERLCSELPKMVKKHLSAGKRVGFHGATHGLNTLCHITGLKDAPLFIFDGDRSKTGFYLPASTSKIRAPDDPLYAQMDLIIVSAMSFEEEIMADAAARTGLGATNILPMIVEPDI